MSVWSEIFQTHLRTDIEAWLSNKQIKQSIVFMFAVMDHLFSYELYQYLCGIEGVSVDIEESVGQSNNAKVECEEWIPIKASRSPSNVCVAHLFKMVLYAILNKRATVTGVSSLILAKQSR